METLPFPRIFVENDALAFFDVAEPEEEPIDVSTIVCNPAKSLYRQAHNHKVRDEDTGYFTTGSWGGHISTISVTTPCVVYAAFTSGENGMVSSGVYHAYSAPLNPDFVSRLDKLVSTVRVRSEPVIIKAAGGDAGWTDLNRYKEKLDGLLVEMDAQLNEDNLILGGAEPTCRRTEFWPRTGSLVTYPNSPECDESVTGPTETSLSSAQDLESGVVVL